MSGEENIPLKTVMEIVSPPPPDQFDGGPPKIHEWAIIGKSVQIGRGSVVWAFSSIHEGARLGRNVSIGERTHVGRNTVIGDGTRTQDNCHLTDHMIVGDRVFFGPSVTTMNDRNPSVNNPHYKREPPVIEDDVMVGAGALILPGVRLGRGCKIGAGAIVTKDVPPYSTVRGEQARITGATYDPSPTT